MGRGGTRFDERREAILAAAAQEFNQHGIRGGTLAGVAARVGLLKGSLNYYYPRKEELAAECMLQAIGAVRDIAVAARSRPDAATRIRAFLAGKAALHADIAERRRGALVAFNDLRALAAPQGERAALAYAGLFRAVRELLPATLGHDPRNARAHLLLALANALPEWLARYESADYAAVADALADMLVHGLLRDGLPAALQPLTGAQVPLPPRANGEHALHEAFLRTATALVNEQGFRGASVERISAQLNLTKGAFYHHHDSKDVLVMRCFERSFEVIRSAQLQAQQHGISGAERLLHGACALVRFQLSSEGPLLRSSARSVLAEAARRDMLARAHRLTQRFALFIVDGIAEGALRCVDATLAAQQVAAMVNAASSLRWWVPGICEDDAVRLFALPLFEGIAGSGSAARVTRPSAIPRLRRAGR